MGWNFFTTQEMSFMMWLVIPVHLPRCLLSKKYMFSNLWLEMNKCARLKSLNQFSSITLLPQLFIGGTEKCKKRYFKSLWETWEGLNEPLTLLASLFHCPVVASLIRSKLSLYRLIVFIVLYFSYRRKSSPRILWRASQMICRYLEDFAYSIIRCFQTCDQNYGYYKFSPHLAWSSCNWITDNCLVITSGLISGENWFLVLLIKINEKKNSEMCIIQQGINRVMWKVYSIL